MAAQPSFFSRLRSRLASPWLVLIVAFALAVPVLGVLMSSYHGAATTMATILTEKGASLIRSFEAGARTGMRHASGLRLQVLLEEMSDQPDIRFIAVISHDGRVLAYSDPDMVGKELFTPAEVAALDADSHPRWTVSAVDGSDSFIVYQLFSPANDSGMGIERHGHGRWMRPERPMGNGERNGGAIGQQGQRETPSIAQPGRGNWDASRLRMANGPAPIILVGLEMAPFLEARNQDHAHFMMMLALACGVILAGGISLLWSQRERQARRNLLASQAFSAKVVSSLPDGLVAFDSSGRIDQVNAAAAEMLALAPELVLSRPADVLPAPLARMVAHLQGGGTLVPTELDCPQTGGCTIPLGVRGARIVDEEGSNAGFILLLRDLRELRHLEAEVRRREKLVAVGSLAAGVAHELRNPLSSIKGYATYFGTRFPEGSDDREAARVMVQEVDRLNRVITDLIGLSRPSDITPVPTDTVMLAEHALRLVRQDAAMRGVEVRLESGPGVPLALLDPDRFSQALLNVCLNGMEAMPEGGTLTVSVRKAPDGRVAVTVRDTGEGIAPEYLTKVFDPYFTTKGHGTGLGLAIVHKIVEAHDGEIAFSSNPGTGTECTFLLPAAQQTR